MDSLEYQNLDYFKSKASWAPKMLELRNTIILYRTVNTFINYIVYILLIIQLEDSAACRCFFFGFDECLVQFFVQNFDFVVDCFFAQVDFLYQCLFVRVDFSFDFFYILDYQLRFR